MSAYNNLETYFRSTQTRPICINWIFNTAQTLFFHPFEYASTLIELGYEPFSPSPIGSSFDHGYIQGVTTQSFYFPPLFEYIKYITSVDGIHGCYRGLIPNLCCSSVLFLVTNFYHAYVMNIFLEVLHEEHGERRFLRTLEDLVNDNHIVAPNDDENDDNAIIAQNDEQNHDGVEVHHQHHHLQHPHRHHEALELIDGEDETAYLITRTMTQFLALYMGVVVSHPFHVIYIRSIAQFVGRETRYSSFFGSIVEIFKAEGISGFFTGLVPRIIGHVEYFLISALITFVIRKVFNENLKPRTSSNVWIEMLTAFTKYSMGPYYTSQYIIEANSTIVKDTGLAIALPPIINYEGYRMNGSGYTPFLFRSYDGPYTLSNGQLRPSYPFGPIHKERLGIIEANMDILRN